MTKSSFINPNTLSLPESSSPTPEPGPSRKRPRTEMTSEERKEARAHRNRIAAQNSRDRRKAQFSHLERRVAELEEENRQLRAGLGISSPTATRDRENEELRERIKTLEQGWDAVVKALAAQGLPTLPAPKPAEKKPEPAPATPPSVFFPLSPAPSNSSLEFESNVFSPDFISPDLVDQESTATRHLARVATTERPSSVSLQRVASNSSLHHTPRKQQLSTSLRLSTIQQWKTCSGRYLSLPRRPRRPVYHLLVTTCHQRRRLLPPRRK